MSTLLIAKNKDAKFCIDDYKIGWLTRDSTSWLLLVFGSCKNLESAIRIAKEMTEERDIESVYLSRKPLSSKLEVQTEELTLERVV